MDNKKTIAALTAQVEDLTEMLNRVRSVIRANSISNQGLDPKHLLDMTREEYAEHKAELQKTCDEFDARKKALAGIPPHELEQLVTEVKIENLIAGLTSD
jgi:archaellum component FlaC